MDNLTHSLLAVALSRAGLNKLTPHATGLMLLAANLPDFDLVTMAGGQLAYLDAHRGISHGIAMAPFLALLPVLLFRWRTPIPWLGGWIVSLIALLSHLAMDFVTSYGIRLGEPFGSTWYQWPVLFIFDAVLATVLLLSLAAPALSKLVSGEIGAKPSTGRGWAIFALLFTITWIGGRGVVKGRVEQLLQSRVQQGLAPRRVVALPTFISPFSWRGLVETDTFFAVHDVNLLLDFDPERGLQLTKPQQPQFIAAAKRSPTLARFLNFAQWPVYTVVPMDEPPGAQRVAVFDLRFGDDGTQFKTTIDVDANGHILSEKFHIRP